MSYYDQEDTIVALSTPPGLSGIAVVRFSGKDAYNIALRGLELKKLQLRYAHFTKVVDPKDQTLIDEVVVTYFQAPYSYTGEDIIEISCHGGYLAAPAILELYYRLGARPALPGEFTRRAFVNGKMDLLQAEAVADLIHAVSDSGKKIATQTLSGKLSDKVHDLRSELTDIASILELELDFSEQEITTLDKSALKEKLKLANDHIHDLYTSYSSGKILREGALVPIVGKPNVGKSSLLNALLDEERAIISHIPGTTRDTIEESFVHKGIVFKLVDTAGLRDTHDPIELIGTQRTKKILKQADIALLIVDLSDLSDLDFEKEFLKTYPDLLKIIVYNKSDLNSALPDLEAKHFLSVSALKRRGLTELCDLMEKLVRENYHVDGDSLAITKERHKNALANCLEALERAQSALNDNLSNEFIALDIREAINALDDISGQTTSEDVLNNIFGSFCIGK